MILNHIAFYYCQIYLESPFFLNRALHQGYVLNIISLFSDILVKNKNTDIVSNFGKYCHHELFEMKIIKKNIIAKYSKILLIVLYLHFLILFANIFSSQIRIVIKFNIMCKICSEHKKNEKKYWHNIRYLNYIMQLVSNKIGLLAKQRKFGFKFSDFVFHWNNFCSTCTTIFKVKILFVSQHNFAYFLLVYLTFPFK